MALQIHKNCREQLVRKLSEGLSRIQVKNRMFLERNSISTLFEMESTLPIKGPIRSNLEEYIGETPIYDFLYETLSRELHENQKYDTDSNLLPLTSIQGYENPVGVAVRLVDEFESLPWQYSLSIKFENDFGRSIAQSIINHTLNDYVKLITPVDSFTNEFPMKSGIEARDRSIGRGLGLLSQMPLLSWDNDFAYLIISAMGFVGENGESATFARAISYLKAFCGIGIALRLLKVNYKYRPMPTKATLVVHRSIGSTWQIEGKRELDAPLSDTFRDLALDDLDGLLDSDAAKSDWMGQKLRNISIVLQNESRAQNLLLASQWFFDSYSGKNELLSFVETTVAMEILLGDKSSSDLMGLGELLSNRCAYLIGKSSRQREEVLREFREIYGVRSKIVHRGKSRLSIAERALFSRLQWMCRRVIQEEVELLIKDVNQNVK